METTDGGPPLRVAQAGCEARLTPSLFRRLRSEFARRQVIRLPRLLEPALLSRVQRTLARTRFCRLVNGDFDVRQTPKDDELNILLPFLFNDQTLFRALEALTACPRILSATGRVYRTLSGQGHFLDWHRDRETTQTRLLSMTVNLGEKPFGGGLFQLRRDSSGAFESFDYGDAGDALLFRVSRDLSHRSTPVTGRTPKLIFACWFHKVAEPTVQSVVAGRVVEGRRR